MVSMSSLSAIIFLLVAVLRGKKKEVSPTLLLEATRPNAIHLC